MESIVFDKVTKRFKSESENIAANDGLSFAIQPGEIFGLLGPNGSGKTTAINLLTGLLSPDEGDIRILGKDPVRDWKEVRYAIGLVPQETALYSDLNAYRNLEFHASLYLKDFRNLKKRIEEILELVELTKRAKDKVRHYSGGMKRRLAIGRALLHDPQIMLLDEPTLGVDVQGSYRIWDYIKNLSAIGKTVLVTTNTMSEAEYLCKRLLIIDHGKNITMGTADELKKGIGAEEVVVKTSATLDDVFLHYTGRSLRD